MTAAYTLIAQIGLMILVGISQFGEFVRFCGSTLAWFGNLPKWCRWRLLAPQFFTVGVASIPVVAITGGFIGMILALEGFNQFQAIGQETRLGGVINISVVKQIGPVLAAVM